MAGRDCLGERGVADATRLGDGLVDDESGNVPHTLAEELAQHCPSRIAKPFADIRAIALSHVLTRAVGVGQEPLKVDWHKIDVVDGDVLLLCSDGVHGSVPHPMLLGAVLAGGSSKEIIDRIATMVVESGARDNYSAIVVKIGGSK